jgi:hypothetical protein
MHFCILLLWLFADAFAAFGGGGRRVRCLYSGGDHRSHGMPHRMSFPDYGGVVGKLFGGTLDGEFQRGWLEHNHACATFTLSLPWGKYPESGFLVHATRTRERNDFLYRELLRAGCPGDHHFYGRPEYDNHNPD